MMTRLKKGSVAIAVVLASCASPQPELTVRAISSTAQPQDIAESQAQLALGNVGVALEGFRKALRSDPASVGAAVGIANCYERMGRFELSRKWFETALAVSPDDPVLLGHFAAFLDRRGKFAEASSVRREAAINVAASARMAVEDVPAATAELAAPTPMAFASTNADAPPLPNNNVLGAAAAPPAAVPRREPNTSVTVQLPPPKPVQLTDTLRRVAPVAVAEARNRAGPRLERLSLGEVALVTQEQSVWTAKLVSKSSSSATFRWVQMRPVAKLLNAARSEGLAARTRTHLAERGWKRLEIGDAEAVRDTSLILYPAFRRATAERLARQFGFTQLKPFSGSEIVVLLGRDAANMQALRRA